MGRRGQWEGEGRRGSGKVRGGEEEGAVGCLCCRPLDVAVTQWHVSCAGGNAIHLLIF